MSTPNLAVQKIMTAPAITVTLDDSVGLVKDLFVSHKIQHMMVVEEHKLVGVLCESLLQHVVSPYVETHVYSTRDLATLHQRVHQVVVRGPKRLLATDSIQMAIKLFNVDSVCCIPVVDENDAPVGIVTRGNLMLYLQSILSTEMVVQGDSKC